MAESVFTELVRRAGREAEFAIDSAATSTEEIGNPPHHGTLGAPPSISTAPDAGIGTNTAQGGEQPVKTVPYE